MYSSALRWNVLCMSLNSILSNVFKVDVSLLIFYLVDLSINIIGVCKSPTIIVLMSVSLFRSLNICFIYFDAHI